ncbi:Clp protease N-terminal domain-containing protein [Actinoallomurus sp. CA-150999]|uniref:Clp protease N-terminal domain-containing protein n=1 Tax=Actinoallomurus sp. CA-150999 TaxID=3239887 RepID=UPI003D909938
MFERFADTARRVVVHAQEEARSLEHGHIGTEHLLLGLLRGDTDGAVRALAAAGVDLDTTRRDVEAIAGRGSREPESDIPFTRRAKKVLELSLREALQLGDDYIGSEHILLGLMRETDGVGARVLQRRGVDVAELRSAVILDLQSRRTGRPQPSPREAAGREAPVGDRPVETGPAGEPPLETGPAGERPAETGSAGERPIEAAIEAVGERLTAIEHRLERIERLLRDGSGPGAA